MKYASAIRFGGEVVSAEECDYSSYKHLGLLCPECKDPVFLRAGGERIRGETTYQVGAHFSHFPAKDPLLAAQCERRVNQYGVAELAKRAAATRNQRLKLLQRHIWNIFCTYYEGLGFPMSEILKKESGYIQGLKIGEKGSFSFMEMVTDGFYEHDTKELSDQIKKLLNGLKKGALIVSGINNSASSGMVPSAQIQEIFKERTQHQVDWRLHELVCIEVAGFLLNRKSREIVKSILTLGVAGVFDAMADGATYGELPEFFVVTPGQEGGYVVNQRHLSTVEALEGVSFAAFDHMFLWLICLPWADELDRIRQQEEKPA